jgi:dihydrolipoamide dehydrogenase
MIAILGGGPAGRIAAIHLAGEGEEVSLFERGAIGGQCLHTGCMMVCALNDAARIIANARNLHRLGVLDHTPSADLPSLFREIKKIQDTISRVLDHETREAGVTIHYGTECRVEGRNLFAGGESMAHEGVIVATGSRSFIPDIPGVGRNGVWTPKTLASMDRLPRHLAIIGAGVMGAEFAYIFRQLGCDVTLIARSSFLAGLDPHLWAVARRELAGVEILEGAPVTEIGGTGAVGSVTVRQEGKESTLMVDGVLLATGLVPNSELIHGVAKGSCGEILVDSRMRTSVEGIYAAGDVAGPPYYTPVARHEGIVAAENLLGQDVEMDYNAIPRSLNLSHELSYCEGNIPGESSFALPGPAGPGSFWSVPSGDTGLAKVVLGENGEIAAVYSAGPGSGIIASYLGFLMRRGISADDFPDFFEVHPSTDGVSGLLKYASGVLKRRRRSGD